MDSLPPCFKPTKKCQSFLKRVEANCLIRDDEAASYVEAGFIAPLGFPHTGYSLTKLGNEALQR